MAAVPNIDVRETRAQRAAEREQLRDKLQTLRRAIADSEASRSEAADALAASEQKISDTKRRLLELQQRHDSLQAELKDISRRQDGTEAQLAARRKQLAEILRTQYQAGSQDPFRLLFSGDNPHKIQRDLGYLAHIARAQAEVMRALAVNIEELAQLEREVKERDDELTRVAAEQQTQHGILLKEQASRRTTLANISGKLRAQRREAGSLERDEKRLGQVVGELTRLLERQAREREVARLRRQQDQAPGGTRSATSPPVASRSPGTEARTDRARPDTPALARNELAAEADTYGEFSGSFAKLKGRLRLPLRGDLIARFGTPRPDGGPSWKGVYIRAPEGAEVRAVAPGRVVFSEWLRGFGNMLIIDHGDQYLSIYANNETLIRQTGDAVRSGDPVATVGNTGGNPETGLYFELRHQGRPVDPQSWATLR